MMSIPTRTHPMHLKISTAPRLAALALPLLLCAALITPTAARSETAILSVRIGDDKEDKRIVIDLFEKDAPRHVDNFKRLAREGFYRRIQFHRVFPGVMVQTGDPNSRKGVDHPDLGTGGPGYTLAAEIGRKHEAGAVAMGRLPNELNPARASSGSQFYISIDAAPQLDGEYTVFGKVIEGLPVVEAISRLPADTNDAPTRPAVIRKVEIAAPSPAAQAVAAEQP